MCPAHLQVVSSQGPTHLVQREALALGDGKQALGHLGALRSPELQLQDVVAQAAQLRRILVIADADDGDLRHNDMR
jgi:hypothetical protein